MAVKDGENDLYKEASVHVLHLLKQPTKQNESMAKLVKDLVERNSLGKKFMYRLAMRSYAIQNGFAPYQVAKGIDPAQLGDALRKSAIINLENESLAPTTPMEDVKRFAKEKVQGWHGRILKLEPRPTFALCGGTGESVWRALSDKVGSDLEYTHVPTGMWWFRDPDDRSIIYMDCPHPSAQIKVAMVHTYIVESAKHIARAAGIKIG